MILVSEYDRMNWEVFPPLNFMEEFKSSYYLFFKCLVESKPSGSRVFFVEGFLFPLQFKFLY